MTSGTGEPLVIPGERVAYKSPPVATRRGVGVVGVGTGVFPIVFVMIPVQTPVAMAHVAAIV